MFIKRIMYKQVLRLQNRIGLNNKKEKEKEWTTDTNPAMTNLQNLMLSDRIQIKYLLYDSTGIKFKNITNLWWWKSEEWCLCRVETDRWEHMGSSGGDGSVL